MGKDVIGFIEVIAPYIVKYAKEYGYKVASPIIAQACLESAYGTSRLAQAYHNYFGMKCGKSWTGSRVDMATKEEYTPGTLTDIRAAFRAYPNMDEGVRGYFEFIATKRYANLKEANTPREYLTYIKSDGYATSLKYVDNNMRLVDKYNLTRFDDFTGNGPDAHEINYVRVTNCCYLNCRGEARGEVLGVFKGGALLILLDKSGTWWKVSGKTEDNKTITGYCLSRYLIEV